MRHAAIAQSPAAPSRPLVAAVAFLTLVDLFAVQAIIPTLTVAYRVTPAEMGLAVNACAFGMAAASLLVAVFGRRVGRRDGVAWSLVALAMLTAVLGEAPDLTSFAAIRVAQGLCMATAFSLTLAALGERLSGVAAAGAFAAYVAGNVGSNLFGRLAAATLSESFGLQETFLVFAALNLAGAALVRFAGGADGMIPAAPGAPWAAILRHLRTPRLAAAFGLGFTILFAFIGVFTYVNFRLTDPEIGLSIMALGFVYLVFAPSLATTLLAGRLSARFGTRLSAFGGLLLAGFGAALLLLPSLNAILVGMTLVAVGTFFTQAVATGYVGRAAASDRPAASGLYLAFYFAGGLAGAWALGRLFEGWGWGGCIAGVAVALGLGALLALGMKEPRA